MNGMREEIRGKRGGEGEASPSVRAGGKTEVTHRKMLPLNHRKREGTQRK